MLVAGPGQEGWGPCSPPSAMLRAGEPWEFSPASGLQLGICIAPL